MKTILLLTILTAMLGASCRSEMSAEKNSNSQTGIKNSNSAVVTNTPNVVTDSTYEVVNTYKHDSKAFTQGLIYRDGFLYESTGQNGESTLRKVELQSGKVVQKRELEEEYFGEGMTVLNGKIYQITWTNGVCFVYDLATFEPLSLLAYNGQGWGLTNDGTNLIMSDGSHQLKFIDPATFKTVRTINVFENNTPRMDLNELEFIKGEIWANVWHTERIIRINPADGKIIGSIDLRDISPDDVERDEENTLNGIAYDEAADRIFVTGKKWKKLFEIKVKPKA